MSSNTNINGFTASYIRNAVNSFPKIAKDVSSDIMPKTSSLVFDRGKEVREKITEIKENKYTFKDIKDKMIGKKYNDDSSLDNVDDKLDKEFYEFSDDVVSVTDKNIKFFTKTNKNIKVVMTDLVSVKTTKTVKSILVNTNNILIDSLGIISNSNNALVDFQYNVQAQMYKNTANSMQNMLQLLSEANNNSVLYIRQKTVGIESDLTFKKIESLTKVENLKLKDEMTRVISEKFDTEKAKQIINAANNSPITGLWQAISIHMKNKSKYNRSLVKDIKSIPNNFNNYLIYTLERFKESDNELVKWIGDKFGIDSKDSKVIYRDNYNKEALSFDSYTKRAITHVIPTLLSNIYNEITKRSSSDKLVYDYDMGAFTTEQNVQKLKSKQQKVIQQRIKDLDSANKVTKAIKYSISYRDRFSESRINKDASYRRYKPENMDKAKYSKKPQGKIRKIISKADNAVFRFDNIDSKLGNIIEKILGIANSVIDPETGMPNIARVKELICKPIKAKFGEYLNNVKNFVKETYGIAVSSIVGEFKKEDTVNIAGEESTLKKVKSFLSNNVISPVVSKFNDVRVKLLLSVRDYMRGVTAKIKARIKSKNPEYESTDGTAKSSIRKLTINKDDKLGFNKVMVTMGRINAISVPIVDCVKSVATNITNIIQRSKKAKRDIDEAGKSKLEIFDKRVTESLQPLRDAIKKLGFYQSLAIGFMNDSIKSVEPVTLIFKTASFSRRIIFNTVGIVTDMFANIFKEFERFVRNIADIFLEKVPAILEHISRFTDIAVKFARSKFSRVPMMVLKSIATASTRIVHTVGSMARDLSEGVVSIAGDAVRGTLVTLRILGNMANKTLAKGKATIMHVMRSAGLMMGRDVKGKKRLEFARITDGYLDGVNRIITVKFKKKNTKFADEDKDDNKDRNKVLKTTEGVLNMMGERIDERAEAVNELMTKLMRKPLQLAESLFKNVFGFMMGGTVGTFLGNTTSKILSKVGKTKFGKFLGLDKVNKITAKKVYIDGGNLDSDGDDGIIDDIVDEVTDGDSNIPKKGLVSKGVSFLKKHKKGALIVAGTTAAVGSLAYFNKKNKEKEEKANSQIVEMQTAVKSASTQQQKEMGKEGEQTAKIYQKSQQKAVEKRKKDSKKQQENVNKKLTSSNSGNDSLFDADITKGKNADAMAKTYRKNMNADTQNKSQVFKKLNDEDKLKMMESDGVQGIYGKTVDPADKTKVSSDYTSYKGMIKDFNKGFIYGGMVFGIINMLSKGASLSKFRTLTSGKQSDNDSDRKLVYEAVKLGRSIRVYNDGVTVDPLTEQTNTVVGGNINWPTGSMKLGEKMVMYGKLFLPTGKLHYSQALNNVNGRWAINNQGASADCSSFVQHIYKVTAGIDPGSNSSEQSGAGIKISNPGDLREGDILWRSGHVAMYAGNNKYLNVGGNPDPDWRDFNPSTFSGFTYGRRVINPDQMVDASLNNPNLKVTGLSGSKLNTTSELVTQNADRTVKGDPPESALNVQNADKSSTVSVVKNTDIGYESKSLKDRQRTNENINNYDIVNKMSREAKKENEVKLMDVSLESGINQKMQDNTLYSRKGIVQQLQNEIVNILQSIDIDIETLLTLGDQLVVYMGNGIQQIEGL